jgi:hypothetical protein
MAQTLAFVASPLLLLCGSALLCFMLFQRPVPALAGHSFSRQSPPGGGQGRDAQSPARTGSAHGPSDPSRSGLSDYPDRPVGKTPRTPVTPVFVVEHRTALKGKEVTVRGRVAAVPDVPPDAASARIFMAETSEPGRDKNYDLMVIIKDDDDGYCVGDEVEVKGRVESSKAAVYLRKSY